MARPLRVEYPGAYYHVINRGNRRQTVFSDACDAVLFFEKLEEFSGNYHVEVLCYCLMHNHYHLYLRTLDGNLSKFMQAFMTSFTISKNRRDRSSGHLFQGRYKAWLVEDNAYGRELSRYIHLNPVRTVNLSALSLKEKRGFLRDHKLSSYPAIIGLKRCPGWLKKSEILKSWGKSVKERQRNYAKYVEEGLVRDIENPHQRAVVQTVLGTDRFIDRIRLGLTDLTENLNVRRELGTKRRLLTSISLERVIMAVTGAYKVKKSYVLTKNSRNNEARQVLLYLACKYCRGSQSLTKLGTLLGDITVGALTRSRYNMQQKMNKDKKLKKKVSSIEAHIVKS